MNKSIKKNILNKEAGFSLVELMVVVAIIGILAALSVGQVQKQIAKARQSEAKTNLSALYTAESSFKAEFSIYNSDFGVIGLEYGGNLRYATGFAAGTADAAAATAAGYTGASNTFISTVALCTGVAPAPCNMIDSNGVVAAVPGGTDATATAFLAGAGASIYDATPDEWTMDNNKNLVNSAVGIP